MIPVVTNAVKHAPWVAGAKVFEVSESILDFAHDLSMEAAADAKESGDPFTAPTSAILPAPLIIFCGENQTTDALCVCERDGKEVAISWISSQTGWCKSAVARFCPGGVMRAEGHVPGLEHGGIVTLASEWPFIIALINEPSVVRKAPVGSRQQRRSAHRGMGFAVDAWTRVTWDLSKETVAKISRDQGFHKVPLHWRRGHFRRAEEHYKGAMKRPDANRPEDRNLWWQWIEGQWVGHPAFGVKKSVHAPKMSTGKLAKRSAA